MTTQHMSVELRQGKPSSAQGAGCCAAYHYVRPRHILVKLVGPWDSFFSHFLLGLFPFSPFFFALVLQFAPTWSCSPSSRRPLIPAASRSGLFPDSVHERDVLNDVTWGAQMDGYLSVVLEEKSSTGGLYWMSFSVRNACLS